MVVRARFAPSPTGPFHVGGARSALFNWLACQKARRLGEQSSFILRIEDTDATRSDPKFLEDILESLSWLGLNWDEGPIYQSSFKEKHLEVAYGLYEKGLAYWCNCTRDEVLERTKNNKKPGYDSHCRDLNLKEARDSVLRFKVPRNQTLKFYDFVRENVEIETNNIEDFSILKGNKDPLFILANTVDDITLNITHVIRGEEHLANTPKYILLYRSIAPNNDLPKFAHLSLLVDKNRQKLSKRKNNISVSFYRQDGFLPQALVNYLALLGWSPKSDKEIMDISDIIEEFDLANLHKAPAYFDEAKLNHFNGIYIRNLDKDSFNILLKGWVEKEAELEEQAKEASLALSELIKERISKLSEIVPLVKFLNKNDFTIDKDAFENILRKNENSRQILLEFKEKFENIIWDKNNISTLVKTYANNLGLKTKVVQAPLRVATMGSATGLPLFESLEALGKNTTISRINDALSKLS